jgi:hypothetical protein
MKTAAPSPSQAIAHAHNFERAEMPEIFEHEGVEKSAANRVFPV